MPYKEWVDVMEDHEAYRRNVQKMLKSLDRALFWRRIMDEYGYKWKLRNEYARTDSYPHHVVYRHKRYYDIYLKRRSIVEEGL